MASGLIEFAAPTVSGTNWVCGDRCCSPWRVDHVESRLAARALATAIVGPSHRLARVPGLVWAPEARPCKCPTWQLPLGHLVEHLQPLLRSAYGIIVQFGRLKAFAVSLIAVVSDRRLISITIATSFMINECPVT